MQLTSSCIGQPRQVLPELGAGRSLSTGQDDETKHEDTAAQPKVRRHQCSCVRKTRTRAHPCIPCVMRALPQSTAAKNYIMNKVKRAGRRMSAPGVLLQGFAEKALSAGTTALASNVSRPGACTAGQPSVTVVCGVHRSMLHPSRNSTTAYQEQRARRHDEPATWPKSHPPTTLTPALHQSLNHGGVGHQLGGGSIGARCHAAGDRQPLEWGGRKRQAGVGAARQCHDHDAPHMHPRRGGVM